MRNGSQVYNSQREGRGMKDFFRNVAAFLIVGVLFIFLLWVAGCNFDGTWDNLNWDHPTNWLDQIQHPEAK